MMRKFCIFLMLFLGLYQAQAQTCTTNTNNGSWTNASIWSCGNVPLASNDVVINHTGITFTTAAGAVLTVNSLTINNNRDLTISGDFTLIITNNLTLNNQSSLNISGGATIDIHGSLSSANNGNVSIDGAGTGGNFLARGCYTIGGGTPPPNIFGGSNLNWCIQCNNGNLGDDCNQILPVRLLFFKGTFQNQTAKPTVNLVWTMVANAEFQHTEIERSENGIKFEKIGQIKQATFQNQTQTYQFTDENPFPSQTYYRLKEVEKDGFSIYSQVVALNNPIQDWIVWKKTNGTWKINSQKVIKEIKVQNSFGQCLFENTDSNLTEITLNPNLFPNGIYIVSLRTASGLVFKKIQF